MRQLVLALILIILFSLSQPTGAEWENFKPFVHNDAGVQRMPWFDQPTNTLYYVDDYDLVQTEWTGEYWTEPQPVPGPVNTPANELSPVRRGDHLYFSRYSSATDYDFYMAVWNEEKQEWDHIQKVERLSSPGQDWKIWVSSDQRLAYFVSGGSYGGKQVAGGRGIWQAVKENGQWQLPVPVEGEINSDSNEWSIFVDEGNNQVYIDSDRPGGEGDYDIWVLDMVDGQAGNPGWPLNSTGQDRSLWTNGEIIFLTSSGRPGGAGGYDLWIAQAAGSSPEIDLDKSTQQEASFAVNYGGEVGFKILATPENLVETYTELDLKTEILASNIFKAYLELELLDSNWLIIRKATDAVKFTLEEFYLEAQGPFYSGGKPVNLRVGNKISLDYHDYIINDGSRPGVHLSKLDISGVEIDAAYMYRPSAVDPQFGLLYAARAKTGLERGELTGYYLGRINHEVIENSAGEKSYVFPSRYAQHSYGLEGKYSLEPANISGLVIYQTTADRDASGELVEEIKHEHIAKVGFFYPLSAELDLEIGLREFSPGYEYPYVDYKDDSDIEDYIGQRGGNVKLTTVFPEVLAGADLGMALDLDYYTMEQKGTATVTLYGETSFRAVDLTARVGVERPEEEEQAYSYGVTLDHNFPLQQNQYATLRLALENDPEQEEITGNLKLSTKLNRGLFRGAELWTEIETVKSEEYKNSYGVGASYELPNGVSCIIRYTSPNDPIDVEDDDDQYDYDNFIEVSASYQF